MLTHESNSPSSAVQQPSNRAAGSERWTVSSRLLAWIIEAGGLLIFVAVGSVPVESGPDRGTWVGIARTWITYSRHLPRVGHATLLYILFVCCLATLIVSAHWAIWLALGALPEELTGVDGPPSA